MLEQVVLFSDGHSPETIKAQKILEERGITYAHCHHSSSMPKILYGSVLYAGIDGILNLATSLARDSLRQALGKPKNS